MVLPRVVPVELSGVLNSAADNSAINSDPANSTAGSKLMNAGGQAPGGIVGKFMSGVGRALAPQNDNQVIKQVGTNSKTLVSLMNRVVGLLSNIQRTLSAQLAYQNLEFQQRERENREQQLVKMNVVTQETEAADTEVKKKEAKPDPGIIKNTLSEVLKFFGIGKAARALGLVGAAAGGAEVAEGVVGAGALSAAAVPIAVGAATAGLGYLGYRAYEGYKHGNKKFKEREQATYTGLKARGFSDVQIAAVMGSARQESAFKTVNPSEDGSNGIFQWRDAKNVHRFTDLKKFAKSVHGDWRDLNVQLDFFVHELKTTEGKAGTALSKAKTLSQAVAAMKKYERYGKAGNREAYSQQYAQKIASKQLVGGAMPVTKQADLGEERLSLNPILAASTLGSRVGSTGSIRDRELLLMNRLGIPTDNWFFKTLSSHETARQTKEKLDIPLQVANATHGKVDLESYGPTREQRKKEKILAQQDHEKTMQQLHVARQSIISTFHHIAEWWKNSSLNKDIEKKIAYDRILHQKLPNTNGPKEPEIGYKRVAGGHIVAYDKRTGKVIEALAGDDPDWARRRNGLINSMKKDQKQQPTTVVVNNGNSGSRGHSGARTSPRMLPSPSAPKIDLYHLYFGTVYK